MNKIFGILLSTIFFFVSNSHANNQSDPIYIGSILLLTGEGSSWGNTSKNGIEMAIEDLNEKGGVLGRKLASLHQDDQGDPKKALSAFQYLVDVKNIKIIIGTNWSNTGLAVAPLADKKEVLMISPTLGVKEFNESSKYLFNTWPHDFILSEKLADHVFEKGHRNVALIGAEQVWVEEQTQTFKRRFEELGGKIAFQTEPLPGTTDVRNDALKIKTRDDIDAFVSTSDGIIIGSLVAKALKELGVKIPMFSVTLDQSAIDAAQGGFEGLEFLTFLTPTEEFKKAHEARFKTPIDIGADSAYDAVMMIAEAIENTKSTDPETLANYLATIKTYSGMSGKLVSDKKRGFTKEFTLKKVINGKPL